MTGPVSRRWLLGTGAAAGLLPLVSGCAGVRSCGEIAPGILAAKPDPNRVRLLGADMIRHVAFMASRPEDVWKDIFGRQDDLFVMKGLAAASIRLADDKIPAVLRWGIGGALYEIVYEQFGRYVDESNYFADMVGISRADMALLQRQYVLSHVLCSTVMIWDPQGRRMVQFRSLDWPMATQIAAASRVFHFDNLDGSVAFKAAGILGMVGLLTAVKSGFSAVINYLPWHGSASFHSDPTFLLRDMMQHPGVTTYAQAVDVVGKWRPGAPAAISLCGIGLDEACVVQFGLDEFGHSTSSVRTCVDGLLIQTNHYLPAGQDVDRDQRFAVHNRLQKVPEKPGCGAWDGFDVSQTSLARMCQLERTLRADPYSRQRLLDAFTTEPVWNYETAHLVMMVPADGSITMWARTAD